MSETHNYCDAPNGPCIDGLNYAEKYRTAFKALLRIHFVLKNKGDDEPESVLSALSTISHRALNELLERKE